MLILAFYQLDATMLSIVESNNAPTRLASFRLFANRDIDRIKRLQRKLDKLIIYTSLFTFMLISCCAF